MSFLPNSVFIFKKVLVGWEEVKVALRAMATAKKKQDAQPNLLLSLYATTTSWLTSYLRANSKARSFLLYFILLCIFQLIHLS